LPYVTTLCRQITPIVFSRNSFGPLQTVHVNWSPVTAKAASAIAWLGRGLRQAVLPNACVFCGTRRRLGDVPICAPCYADLPWVGNACRRCANPVATDLPAGVCCASCQLNPPPFDAAAAALHYEFPVDAAIKAMKFRRKLFYVPAFAHTLTVSMQELPVGIDALLPVPLHWRRQALRGFNQAAELCMPIHRQTGIALVKNVVRCRATPYQSGLAARSRRHNLQSAFSVRGQVRARHVLIVDDVITTGETCGELANVLLQSGVEKVSVLAIARA